MNLDWSREEISSILLQLEQRNLPFRKCRLVSENGSCRQLGSGSFASVFEASDRSGKRHYALKVTGFGDKYIDPGEFITIMEAQSRLSLACPNIVRVFGYAQLYIWLDSTNGVIRAEPYTQPLAEDSSENRLFLQFVLLEKLTPVLSGHHQADLSLCPDSLERPESPEVLRLGLHMANALTAMHWENILHRDVKLENIFYDPARKLYKLGDFGIAKVTQYGLAGSVAFTKGYGAPEIVGMPDDRYDCTADIYSLGMVLFVLLNGLRFPDSDRYRVNPGAQYCPGYVLPKPQYGSEGFTALIQHMCRFSPDDRPQSMQAVTDALNRLDLPLRLQIRAKYSRRMGAIGAVLLTAGIFSAGVTLRYPESAGFFQKNLFLIPLLISLGLLFYAQSLALRQRSLRPVREAYCTSLWYNTMAIYFLLILYPMVPVSDSVDRIFTIFGVNIPAMIRMLQPQRVGICGLVVCLVWMLCERRLLKAQSKTPPQHPMD